MGDTRYERPYRIVKAARDRADAILALSDDEVIQALAAASQESDPLLANVLATEAMNRMRRSRAITQHLSEGAFAVDAGGRFTFVNPAMARIIGGDWRDHVGASMADTIRIGVGDRVLTGTRDDPVLRVARTGEPLEIDGEIARVGGAPVPASFVIAPILREDAIEGAVVAFRDARERRRAQEELARSERRYRRLYEAAPLMFLSVDADLRITEYNDAVCEELGFSSRELVGQDARVLFPAEDRERAVAAYGRVLATGGPFEHEIRKMRKDGRALEVHETMTRVDDPEGQPSIITICVDVTEIRAAERELVESRERYRALFDHSPYGIVTVGLDGVITDVNEPGLRMTGRTAAMVLGRPFVDFVDEADHEGVLDLFAEVVDGQARTTRLRITQASGRVLDCEAIGVPIIANGEVVGVHGMWRELRG